ncbi:hypothetical protein [Dyadobacter sediminis]|uniref:Uncharacterized protein n=1 Tax=Dyadobacter sediminis TaxID=1493691 RepID=A0A5R9KFB2_9BACT|nr:hypothetical protein [Dyadobacter sediminis]TLU94832.1 hypothetical protein FEM55_11485 [Dyadobacter sediminis]
MKPSSKLFVWIAAAFSAVLFAGSRLKENAPKPALSEWNKKSVKRPRKVESFIGAVLQFC